MQPKMRDGKMLLGLEELLVMKALEFSARSPRREFVQAAFSSWLN